MNKDEIYNYIAEQQNSIEIFKQIKELVDKSETEQIRIKIETKHWYGYSEPFLQRLTHKIITTKTNINKLLDAMIKKERIEIDKEIEYQKLYGNVAKREELETKKEHFLEILEENSNDR